MKIWVECVSMEDKLEFLDLELKGESSYCTIYHVKGHNIQSMVVEDKVIHSFLNGYYRSLEMQGILDGGK